MMPLKIFDAVEEIMLMDDLQLQWQRKNGWKYLKQSYAELSTFLQDILSLTDQHAPAPSHAPRPRARHVKKGVS
jgi:hypothetical protein